MLKVKLWKWFLDGMDLEKVNWDSDKIREFHLIPIDLFNNVKTFEEITITNYSKKRSSLGDTL